MRLIVALYNRHTTKANSEQYKMSKKNIFPHPIAQVKELITFVNL